MYFNSFVFLFGFLPIAVVGYACMSRYKGMQWGMTWLTAASLFFYGYWNPVYLVLLVSSLLVNFGLGLLLQGRWRSKGLLILGIVLNLGVLGYFKYAHFFLQTLSLVTRTSWTLAVIILPLGISFITFQKIAFLVDTYRGKVRERNFVHFCLFVTFFPQLIAGPIVHHEDILPQFAEKESGRVTAEHLMVGLTMIVIGLTKKSVIADSLAPFANAVFHAADAGQSMNVLEAWGGIFAYSFQLYFDFSGYIDIATGTARLFGIRLPLNFNSPYTSTGIIEFWRRWHITLSTFLQQYVYIPLGGNRHGMLRQQLNLVLTMLLGGLWHGAGFTFILWGGVHGVLLSLNHLWRKFGFGQESVLFRHFSLFVTFITICLAWIPFRAQTILGAWSLLTDAIIHVDIQLPTQLASAIPPVLTKMFSLHYAFQDTSVLPLQAWFHGFLWLALAGCITFLCPNTMQILSRYHPVIAADEKRLAPTRLSFKPNIYTAFGLALLAFISISFMAIAEHTEFLYFQF
jgi:D-alanyl-lipoteichoic acid acyltransferase DltB (MBOAT superfamily)